MPRPAAVEHAILIAIWNMLNTGAFYSEPGGGFYTKRNPDRIKQRALDSSARWATRSSCLRFPRRAEGILASEPAQCPSQPSTHGGKILGVRSVLCC